MEGLAFEIIKKKTGREEVECSCEHCQNQCKVPCLGTPDDILRLLEAGYRQQLSVSYWMIGALLGKIPHSVPMVQAIKTEHGCIFHKDRLCELHSLGLKPTEGKLSHHEIKPDNFIFELSLNWNVAKEWMDMKNLHKIIRIFFLMDYLE